MNIRFQDFSEGAQGMAQQAANVARRYSHTVIDLDHVTQALLEAPDQDLETLWQELALNTAELRQKAGQAIVDLNRGYFSRPSGGSEIVAVTATVKTVVELAQREADRLYDSQIRTTHLFYAVVLAYSDAGKWSAVGKYFGKIGVTPATVHERLLKSR